MFTGDGGKGITIAVLEPAGRGLAPNEQWILSLIQGSITGDFNKYSAMTIIDRQNLETILAEQTKSLSGYYSDEDFISIGKLTNARFILTGTVNRTANTYMLELSVSDVETGERKASFPPRAATAQSLENLSSVKEASAELLEQLGVTLTEAGLAELKKSVPTQVQAEAALARGITAQRQGTEVAALSYYYQAAALDPRLLEAVNRSSTVSANITNENMGAAVRNDIQWRREWIERLTETEQYFSDLFKDTALAYTLFYSTEIEQGVHDYENETATFNVHTNLRCSYPWAYSVERALQTIYTSLEATGRKNAWGLANWPQQSITNLDPFKTMGHVFNITIELLNEKNKVIGSKTFSTGSAWRFGLDKKPEIFFLDDNKQTVSIANINIDDISEKLMIRIARIDNYSSHTSNASEAELASILRTQIGEQTGILRLRALSGDEWELYNAITMEKGHIYSYNGKGGSIVIDTVWDEPIVNIRRNSFGGFFKYISINSIIIGNSVTSIGDMAFYNRGIKNIVISESVRYVGNDAFRIGIDNVIIVIGSNVRLRLSSSEESNWRYKDFIRFYDRNGKRAGTYIYNTRFWRAEFR